MNFDRQKNIFNPDKQRLRINILGVGSGGSFLALNLAKLGFNDIHVYDFDKVESHNIPNQFYRISDIDKYKVNAIKDIVKDFAGIELKTYNKRVSDMYEDFEPLDNQLFVFAIDNNITRIKLIEQIKDWPVYAIDLRMGGEEYTINMINMQDTKQVKTWLDILKQPASDLPCGEKSILYTVLSEIAEASNMIKRLDQNINNIEMLLRSMKSYKILVRTNKNDDENTSEMSDM